MTVGELEQRMSAREFAEWLAYTRHFEALPDSWRETGLIASAVLAPYCEKGRGPKAEDFVPIAKAPQHQDQMIDQIRQLQNFLGG